MFQPEKYDNTGNFRSSAIDNWNSLNINTVTIVIHTNSLPVVEMRFDIPPGTSNTDWFSPTYVTTNAWNDLPYYLYEYLYFSVQGDYSRRFFIYKNYDLCYATELGWFVVVDFYGYTCDFDTTNNYPVFRYTENTAGSFDHDGYKDGEVFSIFIS
ncbi:uncharacterized protein [Mytilus edulis]|uniref:uncharacterized protein n=1 Tax=Mytilus edulis TaxID=6550 RepID=UPI0039F14180